jgi:alpha-glucosidase (family GH31 glycosyl hydrolase)
LALIPDLSRLLDHAAQTGEPILRPLAYHYPGYEAVHDQFLLGDGILCAPVLEPGATNRLVVLPPGRCRDNDGSVTEGPAQIAVNVRLESLPFWRRISD